MTYKPTPEGEHAVDGGPVFEYKIPNNYAKLLCLAGLVVASQQLGMTDKVEQNLINMHAIFGEDKTADHLSKALLILFQQGATMAQNYKGKDD